MVLSAAGNLGVRRTNRTCRLHAARPCRREALVYQAGISGRTGLGPACSRAAGSAIGNVSGPVARRDAWRIAGGSSFHCTFIPDGAGALILLREIWRAAMDARRLLWRRRGG